MDSGDGGDGGDGGEGGDGGDGGGQPWALLLLPERAIEGPHSHPQH